MADKETTMIMNACGMYRIQFVSSNMQFFLSRLEENTVYEGA